MGALGIASLDPQARSFGETLRKHKNVEDGSSKRGSVGAWAKTPTEIMEPRGRGPGPRESHSPGFYYMWGSGLMPFPSEPRAGGPRPCPPSPPPRNQRGAKNGGLRVGVPEIPPKPRPRVVSQSAWGLGNGICPLKFGKGSRDHHGAQGSPGRVPGAEPGTPRRRPGSRGSCGWTRGPKVRAHHGPVGSKV